MCLWGFIHHVGEPRFPQQKPLSDQGTGNDQGTVQVTIMRWLKHQNPMQALHCRGRVFKC